MTALVLGAGLFGLIIGSFLNVVIWRVPRGESVVRPRSHCPACGHEVRPRDDIPVVSWLLLRGKCRDCQEPISIRYPLVELLTGGVFAAFAASFGFDWALPAYLYLGAIGVALALIDLDTHKLPSVIIKPSYVVALVMLVVPAAIDSRWDDYVRSLIAMVALVAFYFVLVMAHPRGMGPGDMRLSGVLGIYLGWLGWKPVIVGSFLAFALGAVLGIALLIARRATGKTQIPFGPFMLVGAFLGILWGQAIANAYLDATGAR